LNADFTAFTVFTPVFLNLLRKIDFLRESFRKWRADRGRRCSRPLDAIGDAHWLRVEIERREAEQ
jgi:hypothetical protein